MNLKQPVQLCLPLLSLEISFKFIFSRQPPIFNLEPPTIPPDQLPSQIDINRPIMNYLFLFLNNILGAVWGKNEQRSLITSTLHFGLGDSYPSHSHYSVTFIQLTNLYICIYFNMSLPFFLVIISCRVFILRTYLTSYWYPFI